MKDEVKIMKKFFVMLLSVLILTSSFISVSYAKTFDESELGVLWLDKEYSYLGEFKGGIAIAKNKDDKVGFINVKGQEVIPFIYDRALHLIDGKLWVDEGENIYYINTKGEKLDETAYFSDYVSNEGMVDTYNEDASKVGVKNAEGVEVIPAVNYYVSYFKDGIARVQKEEDGTYQYYDNTGKVIINDEFDYAYDFSNGLASVKKNGKMGAINKKGKVIIPFEYEWLGRFAEGLIPARKNINGKELSGFINEKNETIVPFIYGGNFSFSEGLGVVRQYGEADKWGILKNPLLSNPKASKGEEEKDKKEEDTKTEKPSETKAPAEVPVKYSKQNMTLDGKVLDNLEAYLIDGHNYFKLRDIAKLADSTKSRFAVDWNADKKLISLTKGQAYIANGTELTGGDGLDKTGVRSMFPVEVDGAKVELDAYNINGQTYYQIRDLGEALGFGVD